MSSLIPPELVEQPASGFMTPRAKNDPSERLTFGHQAPSACYFTDETIELPGELVCRKPPPFAQPKARLPLLTSATGAKPLLSAALARKHASSDNMLIVTYVNRVRVDFALAWVRHLTALKQPHHLVAALDGDALAALEAHGVATYLLNYSMLGGEDTGWGTQAFRKLGLVKVQMVLDLARTGVDTLTVDADAIILRDPLPYFRRYPQADVLMSSDHLNATNGYDDDGLESDDAFGSAFNIGFIFIRSRAVEFVQAWRDACFEHASSWDQQLFADVLRRDDGGESGSASGPRTVRRTDRLVPMGFRTSVGLPVLAGVLPVALFASGHTYFVQRMAHRMRTTPYMVHATFQYGGSQGKRHRLREAMRWEDEPTYYTARMLSYEADVPSELVYPAARATRRLHTRRAGSTPDAPVCNQSQGEPMTVEDHFRLLNHQLRQLRNALALAQALGRVLILPRLVCGLDRWWAPHKGNIPGADTRLPLLECPADHVIDLEAMGTPEAVLREHSILCNPRMPAAALHEAAHERLPVRLPGVGWTYTAGEEGNAEASGRGSSKDGEGMASRISDLLYRQGTHDELYGQAQHRRLAVAKLLGRLDQQYAKTAVLKVSGPLPDYRDLLGSEGRSGDAQDEDADTVVRAHAGANAIGPFERTVESWASLWCCKNPPGGKGAGHIWYDFLWDVVPHHDRHRRLWKEPWKPIMGP